MSLKLNEQKLDFRGPRPEGSFYESPSPAEGEAVDTSAVIH